MTKALIDADVLRYELGAITQRVLDDGTVVALSIDYLTDAVDDKIRAICEMAWADEAPVIFLTRDRGMSRRNNNRLAKRGKDPREYTPNFREAIATLKPYKGNRANLIKPLHYDNITEYLLGKYVCIVADGMEADDMLAITQTRYLEAGKDGATIICTRDKDLRMVKGNHFGWACGKQDQFGPFFVNEVGGLAPIYKEGSKDSIDKVKGTGFMFFNYQLLAGDPVDNIPGIPGVGKKRAYALLGGLSLPEAEKAVGDAYRHKYADDWEERLLEQGRLLWMVTHLDKNGEPIMWEIGDNYK